MRVAPQIEFEGGGVLNLTSHPIFPLGSPRSDSMTGGSSEGVGLVALHLSRA